MTMHITLSQHMLESINKLILQTHSNCEILDIYKAATKLQQIHPRDNVALEDIMHEILLRAKPNTAISFVPPQFPAESNRYTAYIEMVDARA
jgi:hypothetical protein